MEAWERELLTEAGIDPDGPEWRLAGELAFQDDNLLETLVRIRIALGMSQEDVAKKMNRSLTTVQNFETFGADPHLSIIRRYALAIGVRIEHDARPFE